jgi:8-oxo-dGTP diphosphatase
VPKYPPGPALTADAVWVDRGRVLLVRRGRPPFRGRWALPGGFVELRETVEEAVERELLEETGLRGRAAGLVGVYSGPDRDPRKPTTTVAYLIRGRVRRPTAGDDAAGAAWVPVAATGPLAFDHGEILSDALRLLRRRGRSPRRGRPRRPARRRASA